MKADAVLRNSVISDLIFLIFLLNSYVVSICLFVRLIDYEGFQFIYQSFLHRYGQEQIYLFLTYLLDKLSVTS